MNIASLSIITSLVIAIIALGLPKKYKWASVGLLLVALTIILAGMIVTVLL